MKMILTAMALLIAAPALAQTAAPAGPHAAHSGHAATAQAQPAADPHAGHAMDGTMKGHAMSAECKKMCEEMKAAGKKMECCDKHAGAEAAADPHAGHDMNPK